MTTDRGLVMTSSIEDLLRYLADNGIGVDDVDRVVEARARRQRDEATSAAAALRSVHFGADVGAVVPEEHRYGKGPRLTVTDLTGAHRAIAAGIAHWEHAADHVDVDEIRDMTVRGLARRWREGDRETVDFLIKSAVEST
jgi:hypothetical protein